MPKIKRTLIVTVADVIKVDIENEKFIYETFTIPGRLVTKEILKKVPSIYEVREISYVKMHTEVDVDKYIDLCAKEGSVSMGEKVEEKINE